MNINHVAIWCTNLELLKDFYKKYFNCQSSELYVNSKKGFKSYFLTFDGGSRIEIMNSTSVTERKIASKELIGYAHLAISVGSKNRVDELTKVIELDGYKVADYPRTTGDGFYESKIIDPEGNIIEVVV